MTKNQRIEMNFDGKFFRKEHVMLAAQEYTESFWVFVDGSDEKILSVLIPKKNEKIDVKNIKDELFGEKIEIVRWDEVLEVLIVNALKPAEIVSIDLDYDNSRARVYVTADQQALTIGKRGQNVRLASQLTRWDLDVVSVSEEDIERLKTEDVEEGEDIGEVVGTARSSTEKDDLENPQEEEDEND